LSNYHLGWAIGAAGADGGSQEAEREDAAEERRDKREDACQQDRSLHICSLLSVTALTVTAKHEG